MPDSSRGRRRERLDAVAEQRHSLLPSDLCNFDSSDGLDFLFL
uniref:Uncharacterized protein n=1 Tax=Nelumbo nucifera TaxID=4432 RepID=A0A822YTH4_NELNU|nr:TPA_asm: hypothetical protein HUJ06_005491 [Nelumbo nucifera]